MVKYYVKGEIIGNNEETTKKIDDHKVTSVFITVKNPVIIDITTGKPVDTTILQEIVNNLKEDMAQFTPKWVEDFDGEMPEYLNFHSKNPSKLFYKGKPADEDNEELHVCGSTAIVLVKNTFHNAINIVENGNEYNPFE